MHDVLYCSVSLVPFHSFVNIIKSRLPHRSFDVRELYGHCDKVASMARQCLRND